jgi:hypothetical protein
MRLSKQDLGLIHDAVSSAFLKLKLRLLGRFFSGSSIYFEATNPDPMDSLESVWRYTNSLLYGIHGAMDEDYLKELSTITGNYVEAERLRTFNTIIKNVRAAATPEEAKEALEAAMEHATSKIDTIVNTETRTVQAFAEKSGIQRIASDIGIEDPNVAFLGIVDSKTCKYCLAMYHMPDNHHVPRVYRLSQVQDGYWKAKDWDGESVHNVPLHPNCRHIMTFIAPNMGFDKSGQLQFVAFGHDEYEAQRGVKKSEVDGFCSCGNHLESLC